MTRPGATDGLACDESRLGRATKGGVSRVVCTEAGGVTNGGADE